MLINGANKSQLLNQPSCFDFPKPANLTSNSSKFLFQKLLSCFLLWTVSVGAKKLDEEMKKKFHP